MDADSTWPKAARKEIAKSDQTVPRPSKKRRLESGWVAGGTHTSGFDEILPTNTQVHLQSAMSSTPTTVPGGIASALGGKYLPYKRQRAEDLFRAGEGSRVDTASSLLALPGGGVAFHTHAGGSTKGQAEGHDVRRRAFARALPQAFSEQGLSVFTSAVMLASRPPGEIARAGVDTTLLRDQAALPTWEQDRHTAKSIVNAGFNALPQVERTTIRKTLQLTFDELNTGAPASHQRWLAAGAPTSPRRSTAVSPGMPGTTSGGGYLSPFSAVTPAKVAAGETPAALSRRASKPFRRQRKY